jgi:DNA-directed RNA polymerase subunit RPC12/RpoP
MAVNEFCSNCGTEMKTTDSQFCTNCGMRFPTKGQEIPKLSPQRACKACGNPINPGDKYCSKCLVIVPEVTPSVHEIAKIPVFPVSPSSTTPISPIARPITTQGIAKPGGKDIPAVEVWQIEVTRNVATNAKMQGNVIRTTLDSRPEVKVTKVTPSLEILNYPSISDVQVSGSAWTASKSYTQTEKMAVILDSVQKNLYYLFAPQQEYVPPQRGISLLTLQLLAKTQVNPNSIPLGWVNVAEGDHIKNYLQVPKLIQKDFASLFSVIPLSTGKMQVMAENKPEPKKGLLSGLGSAIKSMNIGLGPEQYEPHHDPKDKIADVNSQRENLIQVLSGTNKSTTLAYKQRTCSSCGLQLVFDPNEEALFCSHCGAYVLRYGIPLRQKKILDGIRKWEIEDAERRKNASFIQNTFGSYASWLPSPEDMKIMNRSAFCPQCSSWLLYIFNPNAVGVGIGGNHAWFCPHCISLVDQIMDRPLAHTHTVSCSICGSTDPSLANAGTTTCPSCSARLITARWEALQPVPADDTNDPTWRQLLGTYAPMFNYRLADINSSR